MSIGICRAQKVNGASGSVGAYIHNERIKGHSNSNPDIDFSRSMENYHIGEYDVARTYNKRIEKRLEEGYKGKKAVRKDAVKMVEVLFTSDKAFFESQPDNGRAYFEDCLKWASERFGKDNIIADVVHLDEATPHMHLDFVPLTADGRLSAKELLGDKKHLQKLQDDFYENVGRKYGLDRGNRADLNAGESGRKNLTVHELKLKTIQEDIKVQEKRKADIIQEVNSLSDRSKMLKKDVLGLQADKTTLQAEIDGLEARMDDLSRKPQTLVQKFLEHPQIKPLFEKFVKHERDSLKDYREKRTSIKEDLSRYQTEVDAKKKHRSEEQHKKLPRNEDFER